MIKGIFFALLCTYLTIIDANGHNGAGINGGHDAPESGIPYMVYLIHNATDDAGCGGAILNQRWVLTAGHCIFYSSVLGVVVGTNYKSKGGTLYKTVEQILHPDIDGSDLDNDIALLKLEKDIEFSDRVQPIKLPEHDIGSGVNVMVSGWGHFGWDTDLTWPDHLQVMNLTTMSLKECQNKWPSSNFPKENCLCAIADAVEIGLSRGDSGGPLVDKESIVGVVKRSESGTNKFNLNGFMRVYYYLDWIKDNISK